MKKQIEKSVITYYASFFNKVWPVIGMAIVVSALLTLNAYSAHDANDRESVSAYICVGVGFHKAATEKLCRAIERGDVERTREAIEEHADINAKDDYGFTPLMRAVCGGTTKIVQLLLEHKALVNIQRMYGWSALMDAVESEHIEIIRLVLEHNANPNIKKSDGNTSLMIVSHSGFCLEVIHLLLEYNADINIQNVRGHTAFMESCLTPFGHDNIGTLILHGSDVNVVDKRGETVFDMIGGLQEYVKPYIATRADLENELGQQNWDAETPSLLCLLQSYIMPHIVFIVCAYGDPYATTSDPILLHAMKHYIRNNRPRSFVMSDICCAAHPDCLCSNRDGKKGKTLKKCVIL